jgi:hypothetical protein
MRHESSDSIDEEELQELSEVPIGRRVRKTRNDQPASGWCVSGTVLEIVLPLTLIGLLAVSVLVYNVLRYQEVLPCNDGTPMAKHFYCFNSSAAPGVHQDRPAGPAPALAPVPVRAGASAVIHSG